MTFFSLLRSFQLREGYKWQKWAFIGNVLFFMLQLRASELNISIHWDMFIKRKKGGRKEFLHFTNPILYLTSVIKLYVQLLSDNIYTAHLNIYTA